jgi:hypothetical protein
VSATVKDRLLTALDRDPDLLYDVYLALLDRKFCGPWVPVKDVLGRTTGRFMREDHSGEACAWVKPPFEPNSFGPRGQWQWEGRFLPLDEIDAATDAATDAGETFESGAGGFADDQDEAMHLADEVLRDAGWVIVPCHRWVSPSGPEGPTEEPDDLDKLEMRITTQKAREGEKAGPFNILADLFKAGP